MTHQHNTNAGRAAASPQRGKNPYDKPGFPTEPYSLYFYYFKPNKTYPERIFYYESKANKITVSTLKRRVTEFAENAANGDDVPPSCKPDFKWRKKSYLAIVMDDVDWKFASDGGIVFKTENGGYENHTFYDAEHDSITIRPKVGPKRELSLFYCINHMKRDLNSNDDIGYDESQRFEFELRSERVHFGPYEADGTNLGPPVPPPATLFVVRLLHGLKALLHL